MIDSNPSNRQPVSTAIAPSRMRAAGASAQTRAKPSRRRKTGSWQREQRRNLVIAIGLTVMLAGVIGYGLHIHKNEQVMRALQRAQQIAMSTKDGLRSGTILFVPVHGNICRQRRIDNTTWTVRDGDDVVCDEAVNWNATTTVQDNAVGDRIGAVRSGFAR